MFLKEKFVATWSMMAEILSIRDLPDDSSLSECSIVTFNIVGKCQV